jgi:hypothetical protein
MPKPPEPGTLSDGTPVVITRPDALPREALRRKLHEQGSVRWDECHEPVPVDVSGYTEKYTLACPLCDGIIIRVSDRTPGDKESWFKPCTGCGLTGDGVSLTATTSRRSNATKADR